MYTGVLYHNYIINFYISIGYPIGPPSKLYENNKSTIKLLFLADSITPQSRPINILITDLHDHFLCRTFYMVDIGSNIPLAELNSKPHGGQSLKYFIYRSISALFYPPPGSNHHKLLCVDIFHVPNSRQVNSYDNPEGK